MILHSYVPGPSLGDFVEQLRLCSVAAALFRAQILPQGTIEFVVNHGDDEIRSEDRDPMHPDRCRRHSGTVVCVAYRGASVTEPARHAPILGVHFRPGGALPFLDVRAGELADSHVDLKTL